MKDYAAINAAKAAKKAEKKAKFGAVNEKKNLKTVEMRIPWTHEHHGKVYDIDLEVPPWDSYPDALERTFRYDAEKAEYTTEPLQRKIVRT